jgi:hypothetical protein
MALVTITEAAILTGKARKTLYAHLKKGKLLCRIQEDGSKQIDTIELIRTYGALKKKLTLLTPETPPKVTPSNVTYDSLEILVTAVETMRLQQELDREENVLLRKQLRELTETVSSLTNILEYKPEAVQEPKQSSGSLLAARAVEAAKAQEVVVAEPTQVNVPLTDSYLEDIPSFFGKV